MTLEEYLQQLLPAQQPVYQPTAVQGLLTPRQDEVTAYDPSLRRQGSDVTQGLLESIGMDRGYSRRVAQNLLGGESSVMPGGIGIADFVPFVGYGLGAGEAVEGVGQAKKDFEAGNYGSAALNYALSSLGLLPAVGATVAGKGAVKNVTNLSTQPQQVMSEFVPNVERGSEMYVNHNLRGNSVLFAEEFGGLPAPSLAVSKRMSEPLQQYGEISLIGTPGMAIPSAKNPVYPFDAYTKRNPKVYTSVKPEFEKEIQTDLLGGLGKFSNDRSATYLAEETTKNLRSNLDSDLGRIQFLREINQLPDINQFDNFNDFNRASREKLAIMQQDDFDIYNKQEKWANNKFKEIKNRGATEDKIYKGRTASGKERYIPATMESIVKETIGNAGDESMQATLGAIRAKISPKFTNSKQVKAARDKIVSADDFNAAREKVQSQEEKILYDLMSVADDVKVRLSIDGISDLRQDIMTGQLGKYDYSKPFVGKIPQTVLDNIQSFKKNLSALPTEYFEVKPKRGVPLSEFAGAIVPQETSQNVLDSLKRQGITNIQYYKNADERKKLIDKFGDKMFQIGAGTGVGVAGLLSLQEDEGL